MTAAMRGAVTGFLIRASIIAGLLAIVAGIFGMHVMTGNHAMHSPAAAHAPAPGEVIITPASCTCSDECARGQDTTAACVPSVQTGTLAAPGPGQGTLPPDNADALHARVTRAYAYLPDGPSPGKLSISRT